MLCWGGDKERMIKSKEMNKKQGLKTRHIHDVI